MFKKATGNEPYMPSFSPTGIAKCPIILRDKLQGKHVVIKDEVQEIFLTGNKVHVEEGIWRKGARGLIDTEYKMTVVKTDNTMRFSGYADFIMVDSNGLYIEDLKTCDRKAFYHFNNHSDSFYEKLQISAYRWLYFQIHKVIIERGVITKIDRENPRNRISLEIPLYSIEFMDKYIENHPAIRAILYSVNEEKFLEGTKRIMKKNRWLCKYCEYEKECTVNKELTKEEAIEKLKKKKAKATFEKLIK